MLESKLRLNDLSLALYQTQINPTNVYPSEFQACFSFGKTLFCKR